MVIEVVDSAFAVALQWNLVLVTSQQTSVAENGRESYYSLCGGDVVDSTVKLEDRTREGDSLVERKSRSRPMNWANPRRRD